MEGLEKQFDLHSPKLSYYLRDTLMMEHPPNIGAKINTEVSSKSRTSPVDPLSDFPHSQAGQANESHGLFYCFGRQFLAPSQSSCIPNKPSAGPQADHPTGIIAPNPNVHSNLKRFLVFDQSADRTTLIYSLIGNPISPPVYEKSAYNTTKQDPVGEKQNDPCAGTQTHGSKENPSESGLHEDTEELNALLYSSDEDDNTEDDEETSTGHSPDNPDWFEEVASSNGASKRRKLSSSRGDSDPNIQSLMDTASSARGFGESNEIAKSASCAENSKAGCLENTKMGRILEMVRILQRIVPGVKGEEAGVVLDETIRYLKCLKRRSMELGLKTLCDPSVSGR